MGKPLKPTRYGFEDLEELLRALKFVSVTSEKIYGDLQATVRINPDAAEKERQSKQKGKSCGDLQAMVKKAQDQP